MKTVKIVFIIFFYATLSWAEEKGAYDSSKDIRERHISIKNAWQSPTPEKLAELKSVLSDAAELRPMRVAAARSLAKSGDVTVVDQIQQVIATSEDRILLYGLASALGELKEVESIALLSNLSRTHPNSTLRYK